MHYRVLQLAQALHLRDNLRVLTNELLELFAREDALDSLWDANAHSPAKNNEKLRSYVAELKHGLAIGKELVSDVAVALPDQLLIVLCLQLLKELIVLEVRLLLEPPNFY